MGIVAAISSFWSQFRYGSAFTPCDTSTITA